MNRARRRAAIKNYNKQQKKNEITVRKDKIDELKEEVSKRSCGYTTETLMVCFGLVLGEVYGFDRDKIIEGLEKINTYAEDVTTEKATMEDYMRRLEDVTGISIVCES